MKASPPIASPPQILRLRRLLSGLTLTLVATLGACGSTPHALDLTGMCPPTQIRVEGDPLASVHVKLDRDIRPPGDRGRSSYPGESSLDESDLLEPTDVVILRVLARDLVRAGVAREASITEDGQRYTLGLTLIRGGALFDQGVESLTMVIPTSSIEATCRYRVRLRDDVGRIYLEKEFAAKRETSSSLVGGTGSNAAEALANAIREAIDRTLPEVHRAPDAFWEERGEPPPAR